MTGESCDDYCDIAALAPDPSEYPFADKTKFLSACLISRLSSDLYDQVASIESRNGFEVYRQISQMIDAVPENVESVMNAELLQLASTHGQKVHDLKSLYTIRLLLKKRNAEYRKIIGESPKDEQSKLILWNVLDAESKRLAATEDFAKRTMTRLPSGSTTGTE